MAKKKTEQNKSEEPVKVVFAPGCFDGFDGTQEELDEFVAEITNMFEGKTRDELESDSQMRRLTEEDFDELPEEVRRSLMQFLDEEAIGQATQNRQRKLQ